MSESLNILCVVNFSIALVLLQISSFSTAYELKKVEIPEDGTDVKFFTEEEIAKYDGSNPNRPIYMAIKGVVFDVSSGKEYYGKDGNYNIFAGKDASRAHAKFSTEKDDVTSDLTGLSDDELKELDRKVEFYNHKYTLVGYMDTVLQDHKKMTEEL